MRKMAYKMDEFQKAEFDELQSMFTNKLTQRECILAARLTALTVLTAIDEHNGDVSVMVNTSLRALRFFKR